MNLGDLARALGLEPDIDEDILRGVYALSRRPVGDPARPRLLYDLGQFYFSRYKNNPVASDLEQAISNTQKAVTEAQEHNDDATPKYLDCLLNLCFVQKMYADSKQNLANATNMIEHLLEGEGDKVNADHHNRLGLLYVFKYEHTFALDDAHKAIAHGEIAVAATPNGDPNRSSCLVNLVNFQMTIFEKNGDGNVLSKAVSNAREAVELGDSDPKDQLINIQTLANVLHHNYHHAGSMENLNEAIKLSTDVLNATTNRDSTWGKRAFNLGLCFRTRHNALGNVEDLDRAIDLIEDASAVEDLDLLTYMRRNAKLSGLLEDRYEITGALEDLAMASRICVASIEAASEEEEDDERIRKLQSSAIADLSGIYRRNFELEGCNSDINTAITLARKAVKLIDDQSPEHSSTAALASALWVDFKARGDPTQLDEALSWATKSVASCSPDDPGRAIDLLNLSAISQTRYEATGDEADLGRCFDSAAEALTLARPQNLKIRAALLACTSSAYVSKCERFGNLEDIHLAVKFATDASTIITSNPDFPKVLIGSVLCTLSNALLLRYRRLEALTDLQDSIRAIEDGVEMLRGHRELSVVLSNLGELLRIRFTRTGDSESIIRAINIHEDALDSASESDPNIKMYAQSMCLAWVDLFKWTKKQDHLNEAIKYSELALEYGTEEDTQHAARLSSSAVCYSHRYDLLKDETDLETAIVRTQDAISAISSDNPACASLYSNLGSLLTERDITKNLNEDMVTARKAYEQVLAMSNARPSARAIAGYVAAHNERDFKAAQKLLEAAIDILPKISPRSIDRGDQEHVLSGLSGISSYAASVTLQAGDTPAHALQLQEAGRGVITGLTISSRSDITDLEAISADLCAEYRACRDELSIQPSPGLLSLDQPNNFTMAAQLSRRHELIKRLDELEIKIRNEVAGCADFQLPPKPEFFMNLAKKGPIVSFNVSHLRCDAFIITDSDIRSVPLPDLKEEDVLKHAKSLSTKPRLTDGNLRTKFERNKKLLKMLKWLWDVAVYPVFQSLGIQQSSSSTNLP